MTWRISIFLLGTLISEFDPSHSALGQQLFPLPYNHDGLEVDLGVGLWAWPIPCDADGDGDFDLVVACPDKPSNGIWFFENDRPRDSRDAQPVFAPAKKLSSAVHYVCPSYVEGRVRVLTPGKEYLDFFRRGLEAFTEVPFPIDAFQKSAKGTVASKIRHHQWKYVDYDGDDRLDLCIGIEDWTDYGWDDAWDEQGVWKKGPLHGYVLIAKNLGTNASPEYAQAFPVQVGSEWLEVFGCPSPNFADFDQDGDLDLLCGEFLDGFTYFENAGSREKPRYLAGKRLLQEDGTPLTMDLEMIVPVAFDWDRDGDVDLIVGEEDGRVSWLENLSTEATLRSEQVPRFASPRYFRQRADRLKCGALATPVGFDWDGDGDTDIISGNTAGYVEVFENLGPGRSSDPWQAEWPRWASPQRLEVDGRPFRIMAGNKSIQGPAEAKWGYTTLALANVDRDTLPDIVFNSIRGEICWLRNRGTRLQPQWKPPEAVRVQWKNLPGEVHKPEWAWWNPANDELVTQWRTTPVAMDLDGDGWTDLAVLDPEGFPSFYRRVHDPDQFLVEPPVRMFLDVEGNPLRFNAKRAGGSGRRKWSIVDWNLDGIPDILLNSANAQLFIGEPSSDASLRFRSTGNLAPTNIEGHDVSPTTVDFNQDGIPDFLGGAEDGHFYYLSNPNTRPAGTDGVPSTSLK